jgi:ribA/ribD-fused uncharacterized protein
MRGQKAITKRFTKATTGSSVHPYSARDITGSPINVKGPKDPGSNFWLEPLFFEGILFSSAEQCYQCHKAWINNDPGKARQMQKICNPFDIKELGSQVTITVTDWEQRKLHLMWHILSKKLTQSEAFRYRLARTGRTPLVHIVNDTFWGTGEFDNGLNHFGHLLEFFREKIL